MTPDDARTLADRLDAIERLLADTSYRRSVRYVGHGDRVECVEVPLDDLNAALDAAREGR